MPENPQPKKKRGVHPNSIANLKMFKPGQSGNPKGPGFGYTKRSAVYQKILSLPVEAELPDETREKMSLYEAIALGQAKSAQAGNTAAWKEIQDSLHGKIPDRVDPAEKTQVAKLFALLLIALQDQTKSPVEQVASAVEGYCRLKGYDPGEIASLVQSEVAAMQSVVEPGQLVESSFNKDGDY